MKALFHSRLLVFLFLGSFLGLLLGFSLKAFASPHSMIQVGAGIEAGSAPFPGILLRVDHRIRTTERLTPQVEPLYYLVRLGGEVSVQTESNTPERIPYFDFHFSAVGVHMEALDRLVSGSALNVAYSRNFKMDRLGELTVSVIQGEARTTLPIFESPEKFQIFVGLAAEALGYKLLQRFSKNPDVSSIYVGNLGLELGTTFNPDGEWVVRVAAGAMADLSVAFASRGAAVLSDQSAYVRLAANWSSIAELFVRLSALRHSEGDLDRVVQGEQLVGGVAFEF